MASSDSGFKVPDPIGELSLRSFVSQLQLVCNDLTNLIEQMSDLPPKPRVSLLGLDKLAAAKKKERLEKEKLASEGADDGNSGSSSSKHSKVHSYKGEGEEEDANEHDLRHKSREHASKPHDRCLNNIYRTIPIAFASLIIYSQLNAYNYRHYRDHRDDKQTPTPDRSGSSSSSYHSKHAQRDERRSSAYHDRKGLYASTNKPDYNNKRRRNEWDELTPSHRHGSVDPIKTPLSKTKGEQKIVAVITLVRVEMKRK